MVYVQNIVGLRFVKIFNFKKDRMDINIWFLSCNNSKKFLPKNFVLQSGIMPQFEAFYQATIKNDLPATNIELSGFSGLHNMLVVHVVTCDD